jgi:hypothetical protein
MRDWAAKARHPKLEEDCQHFENGVAAFCLVCHVTISSRHRRFSGKKLSTSIVFAR